MVELHFENDDELKKFIVQRAIEAKDDIRSVIRFKDGDPFFETLPDVLSKSPGDVSVKVIMVMPRGWKERKEFTEKLETLKELFKQRGNAEMRLIDEDDYRKLSEFVDSRLN